jgi:hypothetical protein
MTRRLAAIGRSNAAILEAIEDHGYGRRAKLLALGDSWFAFPLPLLGSTRNLIDALSPHRRTVAIDLAFFGDTAENMAKGTRFTQLRTILAGGGGQPPIPVAAILISAGGNDLVEQIGELVGMVTRAVQREARAARVAVESVQGEAHRQVLGALASTCASSSMRATAARARRRRWCCTATATSRRATLPRSPFRSMSARGSGRSSRRSVTRRPSSRRSPCA